MGAAHPKFAWLRKAPRRGRAGLFLCLLMLGCTLPTGQRASAYEIGGDGRAELIRCEESYRQKLQTLADKCTELGLLKQAQLVRQWVIVRRADQQRLFLPDPVGSFAADGMAVRDHAGDSPAATQAAGTELERQFLQRFKRERQQQAVALFELAEQQIKADAAAAAYRTLHAVLREDPDHARARRILGYRQSGTRWTLGEDGIRRRNATTTHPRFGWRRGSYWLIESPHFRISTNHSAAAGEKLARQLEQLHAAWQQLFFDFWSSSAALAARFAGEDRPLGLARKHQVVLFRDREEYLSQLARVEPRIQVSSGYYTSEQRTAYLYAGGPAIETNWWHEVSHQLFHESIDSIRLVGERQNFWAVEGIAVYMESFVPDNDSATLGGFEADRLQFARYRILRDAPRESLANLILLGRPALQARADLGELYTQAAWLCHTLMDGPQADRTNPALIRLLRQIYQGRDEASSLTSLTGLNDDEIEADAIASLQVRDADFAPWRPPRNQQHLCLGMTQISDQALPVIGTCHELRWLDFAFTQVTDQGLRSLKGCRKLQRLSLEGTRVTDEGLKNLVPHFPDLSELDLALTSVTDRGLEQVIRCPRLKTLYLTKTQITDAGLAELEKLRQLELVDLQGTPVTPAGVARFRQRLPHVQVILE